MSPGSAGHKKLCQRTRALITEHAEATRYIGGPFKYYRHTLKMKSLNAALLVVTTIACGTNQKEESSRVTQEIVRFTNDDVTLEGDLAIPVKDQRVPLVVFVHGSGRVTREDYADLSALLNANGYATFRYDKRGVGNSGDTFVEVGTTNSKERIPLLASDAAAAIQVLRERREINPEKIIVMGGSQAGWIIPVVVSLVDVSSAVIISGPTVSVGEEIFYSALAENGQHSQEDADAMLGDFRGPDGFDNIAYIRRMKVPSFWIYGGRDVSIPVRKCIAKLNAARSESALEIDIKVYDEADHGLYNEVTHRREGFPDAIIAWLSKH